jgi:hypothetical protein
MVSETMEKLSLSQQHPDAHLSREEASTADAPESEPVSHSSEKGIFIEIM